VSQSASSCGVVFPTGEDGRRSTTATGRAVWADAVRGVDPALAARIERARDWRTSYVQDVVAVTAAGTRDPAAAVGVARAGLASLRERMRFERGGDATSVPEAVAAGQGPSLGTTSIAGEGEPVGELVVPWAGQELSGAAARRR